MPGSVLQFPILGLDEGTNPKALPAGRLKTALNARFDKAGRLAKRFGVEPIGAPLGAAKRMVVRGSELSVVTANANTTTPAQLRTYSESEGTWLTPDDVPDVGATWTTILDDYRGVRSTDFALSGNKLIHAWVTGDPTRESRRGSLWFQVIDALNDTVLCQPTIVPSGSLPEDISKVRVLVLGGYAFLIYSNDTQMLEYTSIDLTTYAEVTTATLSNVLATHLSFDACIDDSVSRMLIAMELGSFQLKLYSQSGGTLTELDAKVVDNTRSDMRAVSVSSVSGNAWVLYGKRNSTDGVWCRGYTVTASASTAVAASVELQAGFTADQVSVEWRTTTEAVAAWSGLPDPSADSVYTSLCRVDTAAAIVGGSFHRANAQYLASKLFRWAAGASAWRLFALVRSQHNTAVANDESPNLCTYLIEYDASQTSIGGLPVRYVAKVEEGLGAGPVIGSLAAAVAVSANELRVPALFQATAAQEGTMWRTGVRMVRVLFGDALPPDFWRSFTIGQEAYLSTGLWAAWDGRVVFDAGMQEPALGLVTKASGTGSIANGNYVYQAMASYRSSAGVLHRGPPNPQRSVLINVASANASLPFIPHNLDGKQTKRTGFGNKSAGAIVEVYRSTANGSNPQRLTYEPVYNTLYNQPELVLQTFVDSRADADIAGGGETSTVPLASRPLIYTAAGELEDVQPPAPYAHTFHRGRAFLIPGSRRDVWWSKDIDENPGIAPGWNPTQRWVFETDLTALWSLDDKLIISSADDLWYVMGDGPNVNGEDNRFTTPVSIQSDVGCTNPRSVVSIPQGTLFQGVRGLYLLSRGLEVVELGDAVRDTLEAFPLITSAVLVAEETEARFTCNAADGSDGRVIVYDYARKEWLVRDYGAAIADAGMHDGAWTFVTTSGQVCREDKTTCLDNGDFVPMSLTFAPISLGGPVSWNRVKATYLIGQSVSNHSLSVSVARDFQTSPMQTRTWEAGSPVTTLSALEKAMVDLKVQKVQAVEISVSDAAPANTTAYPLGTGAGFILEGFALRVQPKTGLPREAAGRRG